MLTAKDLRTYIQEVVDKSGLLKEMPIEDLWDRIANVLVYVERDRDGVETILANRREADVNGVKKPPPEEIFSGDVLNAIDSLWRLTVNPSHDKKDKSVVMWGLLTAAGPSPPQYHNIHNPSHEEAVGARLTADAPGTDVVFSRKEKIPVGVDKTTGKQREVLLEVPTRKGNLVNRTNTVAESSYKDFRKVSGYIGGGVKNRPWTRGLARAYRRLCTREIRAGWIAQLIGRLDYSKEEADSLAQSLWDSINAWANSGDEEQSPADTPEDEVRGENKTERGDLEYAVVHGIFSACKGAPLLEVNVCPFCVVQEISGVHSHAIEKIPVSVSEFDRYDSLDILALKERLLSTSNGNKWTLICAIMHNKLQHALNGNIYRKLNSASKFTRENTIAYDSLEAWDFTGLNSLTSSGDREQLEECEKYLQTSSQSDSNTGGRTTYVSGGTLHQRVKGLLRMCWNASRYELVDPGVPSTARVAETGAGREGPSQDAATVLRKPHAPAPGMVTQQQDPFRVETRRSGVTWGAVDGWHNQQHMPIDPLARAGPNETINDLGGAQFFMGVSCDKNKHHGKFILTDMGETMNTASQDPENKSGVINLNRARTIFQYVVGGLGLAQSTKVCAASDWRELGMRACLYEDLREKRFTQPTGVDWAIATKESVHTHYIPTTGRPNWGYEAVCVNWRYMDTYMAGRGTIPVGARQEQSWNVNSDDVTIIGISENSSAAGCGQDIWILTHLDYPLVYGVDEYEISRAQSSAAPMIDGFVRTSSLVDVHNRARKIIFVLMSDSINRYTIGGVEFRVPVLNRFGDDPVAGNGPVVTPFDLGVNSLLMRVLGRTENLKVAFDEYSKAYFPGGLNWMEIDNLALLCKVRWHNKMSVKITKGRDGTVKEFRYVPEELERAWGGNGIPSAGTDDYGGNDAVSSFDQVPLRRYAAREVGHLKIGRWNSAAELGVVAGLAVYQAFDAENAELVRGRVHAGGQDSLIRAGYWRRLHEVWKRQNGIRDEIASPGSYPNLGSHWSWMVKSDGLGGMTLDKTIGLACKSKYCSWSWQGNEFRNVCPSLTGSRTPSSWWHSKLTSDWIPFKMGGGENHLLGTYMLNTASAEWNYNMWEPQDKGCDDFQLESSLNRINPEYDHEGIKYMALPSRNEASGYGYHVETMSTAVLARERGWLRQITKVPELECNDKWGWGLNVITRDWETASIKKIVLSTAKCAILEGGFFVNGSQLLRGHLQLPPSGYGRDYAYRPITTDSDDVQGNLQEGALHATGRWHPVLAGLKDVGHEERRTDLRGGGNICADTSNGKASLVQRGQSLSGALSEEVGGQSTHITPKFSAKAAQEKTELLRTMVTAEPQPKLGTTSEMAQFHPDHREQQDML